MSFRLPKSAGGFLLEGRSRAADATAFALPELNWMLDCGAIVGNVRPERVFVTHTHSDHANRVTHTVSRARPPTIYVPAAAAGYLEHYIDAHQAMTDNRPVAAVKAAMAAGGDQWQVNRVVEGVCAGECIDIKAKGRRFRVRVVACDHTVDCVGFAFYELKEGLKEEYRGLPGKEIGRLRKEGTVITEKREVRLFAFMGDTTAKIFTESHSPCGSDNASTHVTAEELLKFPVIITECTFLEESEAKNAARTCHSLWRDLEETVVSHPDTTFVLIHFSLRYKAAYVREFFDSRRKEIAAAGDQEPLANVLLWLPEDNVSERFIG